MRTRVKRRGSFGKRSVGLVGVLALIGLAVGAVSAAGAAGSASVTSGASGSSAAPHVVHGCYGLYPGGGQAAVSSGAGFASKPAYANKYIEYPPGCRGHDEPDVAAISSAANSASNVSYSIVLPTDGTGTGARQVVDMGPTFWIGAATQDSHSLFGQAFEELQFYPDAMLASPYCGSNGSFFTTHSPNTYTVCAPAWAVNPSTFTEYAAFNGLLKRSGMSTPLVMHGGDTVHIRFFKGTQTGTPFNISVSDVTTGQSSQTLVLTGGVDGPLAPLSGANTTANFMKWGAVAQAPLSIAWETGHPNYNTYPLAPECLPGMFNCYSYNVTAGWQHSAPLQIKSAQFNNSTVNPTSWTVVDSQGGAQQDIVWCGSINALGSNGTCVFPWYSYNGTAHAVEFGGTYPGVTNSYNTYNQFAKTAACSSRFCATTLSPNPPIP